MAILTIVNFKLMFDVGRIDKLASVYNPADGSSAYNEDVVTLVLTQADGEVYNALSKSYTNAQIEADAGVQRIVGILAWYQLHLRRGKVPDDIERSYRIALETLKALMTGTIKLAAVSQVFPVHAIAEPNDSAIDDSDYFDGLNPNTINISA